MIEIKFAFVPISIGWGVVKPEDKGFTSSDIGSFEYAFSICELCIDHKTTSLFHISFADNFTTIDILYISLIMRGIDAWKKERRDKKKS